MALSDYSKSVYAPCMLGDVSLVPVILVAGAGQAALRAAASAPGVTVATPGSGVYTITFPCRQYVNLATAHAVNSNTDTWTVTALTIASGVCTLTATKSDTTDLASTEEGHLRFETFQSTS